MSLILLLMQKNSSYRMILDSLPSGQKTALRVISKYPSGLRFPELEVAGIYPIEHETGTCGDEFVGSWRMRTWQYSEIELESGDGGDDWLDGRNVDGWLRPSDAAPVSVPGEVILTIRPDATFFELLTPDTGIEILDVADGHIGSPFHGYLDIVDGRTYVFAHELGSVRRPERGTLRLGSGDRRGTPPRRRYPASRTWSTMVCTPPAMSWSTTERHLHCPEPLTFSQQYALRETGGNPPGRLTVRKPGSRRR